MIYDEFRKDPEWLRLRELLDMPGLRYKDWHILYDEIVKRENEIRKEQKENFDMLVEIHKHEFYEKHFGQPLLGEFYD